MMTTMLCAQCGQPIIDLDYFQAGIDMRAPVPVGIKTHPGECLREWSRAHPGGVLWGERKDVKK